MISYVDKKSLQVALWATAIFNDYLGYFELRHEIYPNSKSGNCCQIEWNIQITDQNFKKTRYK